MAQVISLLCDRHLENGEEVPGDASIVISIAAETPGLLRVIDLCEQCQIDLLGEIRGLMQLRGRMYDGDTEAAEAEGYPCPLCEFVGKNHRGTAMHVSRMHDQSLADLEEEESDSEEFPCDECERVFGSKQALGTHKARKHK